MRGAGLANAVGESHGRHGGSHASIGGAFLKSSPPAKHARGGVCQSGPVVRVATVGKTGSSDTAMGDKADTENNRGVHSSQRVASRKEDLLLDVDLGVLRLHMRSLGSVSPRNSKAAAALPRAPRTSLPGCESAVSPPLLAFVHRSHAIDAHEYQHRRIDEHGEVQKPPVDCDDAPQTPS